MTREKLKREKELKNTRSQRACTNRQWWNKQPNVTQRPLRSEHALTEPPRGTEMTHNFIKSVVLPFNLTWELLYCLAWTGCVALWQSCRLINRNHFKLCLLNDMFHISCHFLFLIESHFGGCSQWGAALTEWLLVFSAVLPHCSLLMLFAATVLAHRSNLGGGGCGAGAL